MALILTKDGNYIRLIDDVSGLPHIERPAKDIYYRDIPAAEKVQFLYGNPNVVLGRIEGYTWIELGFDSYAECLDWLQRNTGATEHLTDGSVDVILNDSTSPITSLFFVQPTSAPTALSVATVMDGYTVTVDSLAGIIIGTYLGIFSGAVSGEGRYYWGEVLEINGNVLTLDTPLDFEFAIGSPVLPTIRNMAVDGSVTPQTFSIQSGASGLEVDVTRIISSIVCDTPPAMDLFGDQPALIRGVVFRKTDGVKRNIFNWKRNYDFAVTSYDTSFFEQVKQNDVNAVISRTTFGGQSKMGSVIRLNPNEQLDIIIQDDLTALVAFTVTAQGSEVSN